MDGKKSSRRRDHERDDGGSRDRERRMRRSSSGYDVIKERYHRSEYSKENSKRERGVSENRAIRARREDRDGDVREKDYDRRGRYREDRGGEKERAEENNRDQDHKDKERSEKESEKRKDVGGNEQNADQGLSGGGVHLSAMELEARVLKAKEERLAKKMIAADVSDDILAWVSRSGKSKQKNNAIKEKASQLSKVFEEQDNVGEISEDDEDEDDCDHLAEVKVLHGIEKVRQGGAVVLTLKDQSVLADGGDNINEEVDGLENVEIGEQKQREEAYKAAKRKAGIHDHDEYFNGSEKKILPQYDDPIPAEELILDERGWFSREAAKKFKVLGQLEELHRGIKLVEDFSNISKKRTSDFYTQEEMEVNFKKPKKKKSLRKKQKLDVDALEAEAVSARLGACDLGSRNGANRQGVREEKERLEAERRHNAYKVAYAKADEASKSLQLLEQKAPSVKADQEYNEFNVFSVDDDDKDLHRSLERARKSALRKKDEKEEKASGSPEAIAFLATTSTGRSQIPNAADDDRNRIPSSSEDQSGEKKVVLTETNEFLVGLKLDQNQSHMDPNMQEDDHAEENMVNVAGGWTEVNDGMDREDEEHVDPPAEDRKEEKGVPDGTFHEVAVGKGLSGALKLLKERGSLEVKHDTDAVPMTDEFGRPMTQKEAYNRLSHAFHGKGPGKRKQEKRMKQFEKEQKLKQMSSSDTPLRSMERVRDAQAQLRKPYLILSGHVHPGQTNDKRADLPLSNSSDLPKGLASHSR